MGSIVEVFISKKSRNGFALLIMLLWYDFNWLNIFPNKIYESIFSQNLILDIIHFIFFFLILGTCFNWCANIFMRTYVNLTEDEKTFFARDYQQKNIKKFEYRQLTNDNESIILKFELNGLVEVCFDNHQYRYIRKASYYATSHEGKKLLNKI